MFVAGRRCCNSSTNRCDFVQSIPNRARSIWIDEPHGPPITFIHRLSCRTVEHARYNGAQNLRDLVENNEMWPIEDESEYTQEQYTTVLSASRRCLGVAAQIVEEDICSMEDVDRGVKVGLRWARGPFEMMNRIGVAEAYRMASAYQSLVGEVWALLRSSKINQTQESTGISLTLIPQQRMELQRLPSIDLKQ